MNPLHYDLVQYHKLINSEVPGVSLQRQDGWLSVSLETLPMIHLSQRKKLATLEQYSGAKATQNEQIKFIHSIGTRRYQQVVFIILDLFISLPQLHVKRCKSAGDREFLSGTPESFWASGRSQVSPPRHASCCRNPTSHWCSLERFLHHHHRPRYPHRLFAPYLKRNEKLVAWSILPKSSSPFSQLPPLTKQASHPGEQDRIEARSL